MHILCPEFCASMPNNSQISDPAHPSEHFSQILWDWVLGLRIILIIILSFKRFVRMRRRFSSKGGKTKSFIYLLQVSFWLLMILMIGKHWWDERLLTGLDDYWVRRLVRNMRCKWGRRCFLTRTRTWLVILGWWSRSMIGRRRSLLIGLRRSLRFLCRWSGTLASR